MDRWNALNQRAKIGAGAVALLASCAVCSQLLSGGAKDPADSTGSLQDVVELTGTPTLMPPTVEAMAPTATIVAATQVPPTTARPSQTWGTPPDVAVPEAHVNRVIVPTPPPPTDEPPMAAAPTEVPATEVPPPIEPPAAPVSGCVNINTASLDDLKRIIHIDDDRAAEIIGLRQVRPFRSVDDLTRVKGIGDKRLAEIKAEGIACVY